MQRIALANAAHHFAMIVTIFALLGLLTLFFTVAIAQRLDVYDHTLSNALRINDNRLDRLIRSGTFGECQLDLEIDSLLNPEAVT